MIAQKLLMIRPANFGYNSETATSNEFQNHIGHINPEQINELAELEFDNYVKLLRENSIEVLVVNDTKFPVKPDAIFPNNWFVTLLDKQLFTFPMEATNRRLERRADILATLQKQGYSINRELEKYENQGLYLEGTGSMVMDHKNKMIFAAKSSRTSESALQHFASLSGYSCFLFETHTQSQTPIYHTNVLMSISSNFGIVCTELISPKDQSNLKSLVLDKLIIEISSIQMRQFLGNCLLVLNEKNEEVLILSKRAKEALTPSQLNKIVEAEINILEVPIPTIETIGGGSARCMIAELF